MQNGEVAVDVRLPEARGQAKANPRSVLRVAGQLRMERAVLKRCADHYKQNDQSKSHNRPPRPPGDKLDASRGILVAAVEMDIPTESSEKPTYFEPVFYPKMGAKSNGSVDRGGYFPGCCRTKILTEIPAITIKLDRECPRYGRVPAILSALETWL